jgi:hypothetical protein
MPINVSNIRYVDLARREKANRERLFERLNQIDRTARARLGGFGGADAEVDPIYYSVEEKAERDRLHRLLIVLGELPADEQRFPGVRAVPGEWSDALFVAARDCTNEARLLIGRLGNPDGPIEGAGAGVELRMARRDGRPLPARAAVQTAHVLGILIIDEAQPPPLMIDLSDMPAPPTEMVNVEASDGGGDRDQFVLNADQTAPAWKRFNAAFFRALGEARGVDELAERVLPILADVGGGRVEAAEFARVMRALEKRGIASNEPQLGRRVDEALDKVQHGGGADEFDRIADAGIDLPDLEAVADNDIVADNVKLMGAVICAAMLEELKAFQVVDRIVENAQAGTLPIGQGNAGKLLYRRWKQAPLRMTEAERRTVYAMTMGQPGGDPSAGMNREFNDLWLRFVSSVSAFVRQQDVDRLLRANLPSALGQQTVRKAARDLATNLSLHGYGMTFYAAVDLQEEVKGLIVLLSDPEILAAYAARDMYQVIDTVATLDLGGARTGSRFRTLATSGMIITAWLARNVEKIMRPYGPLLDMTEIRSPAPKLSGHKATREPTDYDLVNACELWLADTAVGDLRVEEMAQPRETPVMTSKPVAIPAFAREFLDELPEMGLGMGTGNGAFRNSSGLRH